MNRPFLSACLIWSITFGTIVTAPVHAGGAISKCVDAAGRVTLTDQPCGAGTVTSSVAVPGTGDAPATSSPSANTLQTVMLPAPVRRARAMPAAALRAPLSGDMATLRQARIQMLLQDNAPRMRLAVLDR